MPKDSSWKRARRKPVYTSKFLKVYEDKVELPGGTIIDDYTVIEKPDIVMVVATTPDNLVIILREYKYAANKVLLTLPAGHKKKSETPVQSVKRELLEETGFTSEEFEELGVLNEYPSKDLHKVYVVRASNIHKAQEANLEHAESLTHSLITISDIKSQIKDHEWSASSALAALTYSGILF